MDVDDVCPKLKRSTDFVALTDCTKLSRWSLCSYSNITPPSLVALCILTTLHKHMAYKAAALSCPDLTYMLHSTLRIFCPDEVLRNPGGTFKRSGVSIAYVCGENYSLRLQDKRPNKTISSR